ncbi:hypothetical protein N431DRAFT_431996 [Stipitochalara longipes BDJ]|nr:hypothetical protein N431DRAFT_431996 [Stipitochalara longipes BDJ]
MADEARPLSRKPRHRQSRGRGLRKTTGCITCRRRHVKCDEERPHCHRCMKGGQTCIYADKRPEPTGRSENRTSKFISDPSPATTRQPVPAWQTSPEQALHYTQPLAPLLENGSPGSTEIPSFQRHSSTTSTNGFILGNQTSVLPDSAAQQVISPEISHAGTTFSLGSNDTGSLVARSVSSQPTFNVAISRWFDMLVGDSAFENGFSDFEIGMDEPNNFDAPREPDRMAVPHMGPYNSTPTAVGIDAASPTSSNPQLLERSAPGPDRSAIAEKSKWQTPAAIELLPYEQLIFRNFVQRISHWIDLFDPTQSFSTFVPHLAMRNTGLMKAILALSARHISLNSGIIPEQTHDRNDALQYYNETLHYLSKAMQYDTYKTSLELLATALIVSTYEMLDGSGKDWERHLQGVFWIQRSQVIHGDSKGLKQAVWWAWLQQDVWAAFREKRKTFTFWKPTRRFDDMNPYELAARSVYVIAKVVNYCSREETEAGDISLRIERADQLQAMLDEWERYLTTEFTTLPFKTEGTEDAFEPLWIHPPAFGVALQLHYSARLLLLLNKPSRGGFGGYLEQSRMISKLVNNICGIAITLTDHASSVMCSQCLYIAGMCIQDSRQRESVLKMLNACRERTGWPISSLGEELQMFWKTSETMPNG